MFLFNPQNYSKSRYGFRMGVEKSPLKQVPILRFLQHGHLL